MLKLIMWAFVCYGLFTLGIVVLLFSFLRRCFIKDIKMAILEAHEEIETQKFYNPKND